MRRRTELTQTGLCLMTMEMFSSCRVPPGFVPIHLSLYIPHGIGRDFLHSICFAELMRMQYMLLQPSLGLLKTSLQAELPACKIKEAMYIWFTVYLYVVCRECVRLNRLCTYELVPRPNPYLGEVLARIKITTPLQLI